MDGHFSEKMNMSNCIQRGFLANLEIFRYLNLQDKLQKNTLHATQALLWGQCQAL